MIPVGDCYDGGVIINIIFAEIRIVGIVHNERSTKAVTILSS
jgi:hypothetical protein